MKVLDLCITLFFASLLLNYLYRLQKGLAKEGLSPAAATQAYVNKNKIKDSKVQIKKVSDTITQDLEKLMQKLIKSKDKSKKNRK